jgi:hypothetical protein
MSEVPFLHIINVTAMVDIEGRETTDPFTGDTQ